MALNKLTQIKSRYVTTTALSALLLYSCVQASENTWVPPSDDTVIATFDQIDKLPPKIKQSLARHKQSPQNIDVRLDLIEAYLEHAVLPGNSRYYGYVTALLKPLLDSINKTPNANDNPLSEKQWQRIVLAQANVLQQQHQFQHAHNWLNKISEQQPSYTQAQLTKARLLQIQGQPEQAEKTCRGIIGTADLLISQLCLLDARSDALFYQQSNKTPEQPIDQSSQQAEQYQQKHSAIYQQLLRVKNQYPSASFSINRWLHRLLGNSALHQQRLSEAKQWFAFELNNAPVSQLLQWADSQFLLNQPLPVYQRFSELADKHSNLEDSLLVRLARAEVMLQRANNWQQKLAKKMALRDIRNDQQHAADLAYYYVYVSPNANKALHWSNENWTRAKEFFDRHLLNKAQQLSNKDSSLALHHPVNQTSNKQSGKE